MLYSKVESNHQILPFTKSNLGRGGLLYTNSVCNVPYDMNNSLGNTTIHTLDPDAMTFVPQNYLIHQDDLLTFIAAVFMTFTFLLTLFLLLIFDDDVKGDTDPKDTSLKIKFDNPNKIIIGHLNINSMRSKIEFLKEIIGNNIYILLVSETKQNYTFPIYQLLTEGYQVPIRVDRNDHGGGLL